MVSQVHGIGCVWKTPFRKSGHNYAKTKFHYSTQHIDKVKTTYEGGVGGGLHPPKPVPPPPPPPPGSALAPPL